MYVYCTLLFYNVTNMLKLCIDNLFVGPPEIKLGRDKSLEVT